MGIWAATTGHLPTVELLLRDCSANPPLGNPHTALRGAAIAGSLDVVNALLAARADVNLPSEGNRTALMGAARGGHAELVRRLLDANAETEIVNNFGESA